jgi:hypothetical protein
MDGRAACEWWPNGRGLCTLNLFRGLRLMLDRSNRLRDGGGGRNRHVSRDAGSRRRWGLGLPARGFNRGLRDRRRLNLFQCRAVFLGSLDHRSIPGEMFPHQRLDVFIDGAGVRFLLDYTERRQEFEDLMGRNLQLSRQLVDADLTHR